MGFKLKLAPLPQSYGKRRYYAVRDAQAVLEKQRAWEQRLEGYLRAVYGKRGPLNIYLCEPCGAYHIGHAKENRP